MKSGRLGYHLGLRRKRFGVSLAIARLPFFYDLCWEDCEKLVRHPLDKAVAQQLVLGAGSISANIEEGYGRGYGRERLYFLHVAVGSARESKGWYYRAKALLSSKVIEHRLNLMRGHRPAHRRTGHFPKALICRFAD